MVTFGQRYLRIDTVNYGNNVDHVKRYLKHNNNEQMLLESYWFNDLGKLTIRYDGYEDEAQQKTFFEYDANGYLTTVKETYYISSHNDSIGELYDAEMMEYARKEIRVDWKKINKKYESLYERVDPEKVDWISSDSIHSSITIIYNQNGKDSLIYLYEKMYNKDISYIDNIGSFSYNKENKLIKERWTDVPQKNVFKFQAFKPSSIEFEDSVKILSGSYTEKTYKYFGDTIKIDYCVNGSLTGYELQIQVDNIIKELVYNTDYDTLSYYINTYNSDNLLIIRHRVKHTGYSGFGYGLDYKWSNIEKYQYDSKHRLVQIDGFKDNEHNYTERFEIIEK